MKKVLAIILSLVLVLTLVVAVACDNENFKEVNLEDKETREEFVNALAEKIDRDTLLSGDPTKEGWTFGLEETAKSKLNLDLALTPAQAAAAEEADSSKFTVKGNVELSESAKATVKSNGKADPTVAASLSLSAKGNLEASDNLWALLDTVAQESKINGEDFDLVETVKALVTNFNYSIDAYADNEAALIKLSDGLYNKLPKFVTDMIGSKLIKITYGGSAEAATLSAAEGSDLVADAEKAALKVAINNVIDTVIIPFKISVAVSTTNGYAVKLTVSQQSVLTVLDSALKDLAKDNAALATSIKNAIGADTKIELVVKVDKEGAFSSFSVDSKFSLNLDLTVASVGNVKGTVTLSGSVEVKKFKGTVSKPKNASEYKEIEGISGPDSSDEVVENG